MITEIFSSTLFQIFNTLGSLVALVLGVEKIRQVRKEKVDLQATVKPESFYTRSGETEIKFSLDLKNSGLEPTTISKIKLETDVEDLNDLEMRNNREKVSRMLCSSEFQGIRLEANDRISCLIHRGLGKEIPEFEEISGKLVFYTHKGKHAVDIDFEKVEFQ